MIKELIKKTKELFRTIRTDIVKKINNYIDNDTYKHLKKKYGNGKYTKPDFAYYLYHQKYENNKELYDRVEKIFKDKCYYPADIASEIYSYFNNQMQENTESLSKICASIDHTFKEIDDIEYYRDKSIDGSTNNYLILIDYNAKIDDVKGFVDSLLYNWEKKLRGEYTYGHRIMENRNDIEHRNEIIAKYIDRVSDKEKQITDPLSNLEDNIHKSLVKLGKVKSDNFTKVQKNQFNDIITESKRLMDNVHKNISGVWDLTKYIIQTYKDIIVKNVEYSIANQKAYDEIIKYDEEQS